MATDKMELSALKKISAHLNTVAEKYTAKHAAMVDERTALLESGDYSSYEEIMDAYGWEQITEEQKDMLLAALESGRADAEADTVWSVAAHILRKEIRAYELEISELQYLAMTPAQREEKAKAEAAWQAEQDERRKRLGRNVGGLKSE